MRVEEFKIDPASFHAAIRYMIERTVTIGGVIFLRFSRRPDKRADIVGAREVSVEKTEVLDYVYSIVSRVGVLAATSAFGRRAW